MSISVSIVCYNTPDEELRHCLDSLHSDVVSNITIIDNSRNHSTQQLARSYAKVIYIGNDNTGYGAGHNIALRESMASNTEYHLVLNSDVYFKPEILTHLTEYLARHPEVGIIQPRLQYPDGRLQYTCRLLPTPLNLIARRFMAPLSRRLDHRYLMQEYTHTEPVDVPYLQGSFLLIRTSALQSVGLFDERFFMYPEDIDLCRRMYTEFSVKYYPAVCAVHNHRAASYHNPRMLKIHMVNMVRYFNKWGWIFDRQRRKINRRVRQQYI